MYKLTTAALILGYTKEVDIAEAKEKQIEQYQKTIFAALEAAPASVRPPAEPSQSLNPNLERR